MSSIGAASILGRLNEIEAVSQEDIDILEECFPDSKRLSKYKLVENE